MEKFGISETGYHELTMHCPDMPRKYLICQCKDDLNKIFHIERTPGGLPGAFISLKDDLIQYLGQRETLPDSIQIKLSGDGTKVSRISSFMVMSYTEVNDHTSQSVENQRVICIVSGREDYDTLKSTCHPIFDEINTLLKEKSITVNDKKVELDIVFGADMKFVSNILGLSSANSTYACPWCKVHKHEREIFDKPWDFYHSCSMFRTTSTISNDFYSGSFNVKHKPLLNIEPCKIIPDELHLLLRVSDRLLRNLIDDAKSLDDKNKIKGTPSNNLGQLVDKIRECGVVFNIWSPKGTNGELEWTSLTGNDYKLLLQQLPTKLCFLIHHDTHDETVTLWRSFYELYKSFNHDIQSSAVAGSHLFEKCKLWAELFLSLDKSRKGYDTVTPYIHVLVYHIPWFSKQFGSLCKFSGQAVEKCNDLIKTIHHLKTNKHDPAVDALKCRKRI